MGQRILRPLTFGDLLDEMFDLYKRHFLLFVGIAAVVHIPSSLAVHSLGGLIAGILSLFVAIPVSFTVMAATAHAVSNTYLGKQTSIVESYRAMRGRFFSFIAMMILVSIIIWAGFMMCIIPGIIFSCWYAFIVPVFVIERKSGSDARNRSKALASGEWGRIIVLGILSAIITGVVTLIFQWPIFLLNESCLYLWSQDFSVLTGLSEGLASTLSAPIGVIIFILLYYDVRVRKEGFDLELLAASMESEMAKTDCSTGEVKSP